MVRTIFFLLFFFSFGFSTLLQITPPPSLIMLYSLVNIRDPLYRLASCLMFRFGRYSFDDMEWDPIRVEQFLVTAMDEFGNGCLNELVRILSGPLSEEEVQTASLLRVDDVQRQDMFHRAMKTLRPCVVFDIESLDDSLRLLRHHFPWMSTFATIGLFPHVHDHGLKTATFVESIKKYPLVSQTIHNLLALEIDLFYVAKERFQTQVKLLS